MLASSRVLPAERLQRGGSRAGKSAQMRSIRPNPDHEVVRAASGLVATLKLAEMEHDIQSSVNPILLAASDSPPIRPARSSCGGMAENSMIKLLLMDAFCGQSDLRKGLSDLDVGV